MKCHQVYEDEHIAATRYPKAPEDSSGLAAEEVGPDSQAFQPKYRDDLRGHLLLYH